MANLSVEQVEALSPTELVNYLNLNKDGLFLRDDHIKTLESLELAGSNFLKLTTQKLTNHPYNFPEGPVERIQDFISRLNSQRLLNLEEYLSNTIPYIIYSPHGTMSRSSTKVSGDFPTEVRLWGEFFNNVNSHTFDQEKKFQRPTFVNNFIKTYTTLPKVSGQPIKIIFY
ncbi:hypothetical protein GLOIN_2v1774892 [Rhizophagus irregularis DAOM 181602=DAOM 197198]|uniref:Uncharacterized protein n=1 Tax=Rhizophagus irregularis (strain DAOM 181602 / DAOM 197198 / MUCL 43194) TaxID=747089 RepID=U9U044_RHIID|nr:hypothetical protein GLOIN_2v1774892 [Rhizophagus irregularis DAOM 181602=DAOM 197198]POG71305.1 hypothetical protein GLOIN_2v1774892 [Rhizophagus irregularis DAOM 181602=DAOM 197198]|eukprot:XP_025178171.1 hypothetical protein GLOIN_2v1774892 [Rhizophagus irregularis DAOM 181602=DAOM 197198]